MLDRFGFRRADWPTGWMAGFEARESDWKHVWCGLRAPTEGAAAKFSGQFAAGLTEAMARSVGDGIEDAVDALPSAWGRVYKVKCPPTWWPAVGDLTLKDDAFCRPQSPEALDKLAGWLVELIRAVETTQPHWPK